MSALRIVCWVWFAGLCGFVACAGEHRESAGAVEQCHAELWAKFVDEHGILRDFVGDLPTPEDCRLGRPNAIGWWSPIENGPMFTGLYLTAQCERARRTGTETDRAQVRKLVAGLLKCASVSDVPGFIARGVGTDGVCHYPMGSDDQTHPWFLGLATYALSDLPTAEERAQVVQKLAEVAEVLQSQGWMCPCDGAFRGQFRGGYRGHLFRDAVRYLYLLKMLAVVTGDAVWQERYQQALAEKPAGSSYSRLELCAQGWIVDREAIARLEETQLWIYVGCQSSLAALLRWETDTVKQKHFRTGLLENVRQAMPRIATALEFDNDDRKVFGNANWRAVYAEWFPQATQADAERLARIVNIPLRGERKPYETRLMRNPLAGAAIVALAMSELQEDAEAARKQVDAAICHYNYERLHMAEFFLAELAYYSLPASR